MALLAPVLLISVSAEFSGEYFINENCGFGVDSQGRAYIGTKKYIYVYEQCELYKKIYNRVIYNSY